MRTTQDHVQLNTFQGMMVNGNGWPVFSPCIKYITSYIVFMALIINLWSSPSREACEDFSVRGVAKNFILNQFSFKHERNFLYNDSVLRNIHEW